MEAMKRYSIVFLDIDGTLLDDRHQVGAKTAALLQKLEQAGIPIVLCSARPPSGVAKVARQAGLHGPSICYAGALTVLPDQAILQSQGIAEELAIRFEQAVLEYGSSICLSEYLYDVWLTPTPDAPPILREAEITGCQPIKGQLSDSVSKMSAVHKMLCIGTASAIQRMQAQLTPMFPQLQLLRSNANYLEVLAKGVCKEQAMDVLLAYYGLSPEQAVAVGDGEVDIGMISQAGFGVAMGNAAAPVKQAADFVTAPNNEEGVYLALKMLRFNPQKQER